MYNVRSLQICKEIVRPLFSYKFVRRMRIKYKLRWFDKIMCLDGLFKWVLCRRIVTLIFSPRDHLGYLTPLFSLNKVYLVANLST